MKIGIISDTHGFIEKAVFDHFKECDEVWHLGDFGPKVYDALTEKFIVRGVFGNIDDLECKSKNPEYQVFSIDNIRFLMLHIGGYPTKYSKRSRELIKKLRPDVMLTGHSHICQVMRDKNNGLLHINPGAAGNYGFHTIKTIMRFDIERGLITNLQVIELGPRSNSAQNYITML